MQQSIDTAKGPVYAKINIPGSKSLSHRALIMASLADGVSELSGLPINDDTRTLVTALQQLGIVAQLDEKLRTCIVAGCRGKFPKKQATLWCNNAGSIARFLLAASAGTSGVYHFDGASSLRDLPISQLVKMLSRMGAQFIPTDARHLPFTLVGADSLLGGEVFFDEPTHSQLLSALLMISPFARSHFTFSVPELLSQPHIDMTCAMMAEFNVIVHRVHQGHFMVPVPQCYQAKNYVIEPDFALAAYFFAAAAVTGGEVTIQPIKSTDTKQVNVKFLTMLEKMGCRVFETHNGLTLKGAQELRGIEVGMKNFSDIFLALAALAPFAQSPTRISHTDKIQPKEFHRMIAIKTELIKKGIHVETGEDWIKIFPGKPLPGIIDSHKDHRIAMAFTIIGLRAPGIILDDTKQITRIYPDFFTTWNKLKEQVHISA